MLTSLVGLYAGFAWDDWEENESMREGGMASDQATEIGLQANILHAVKILHWPPFETVFVYSLSYIAIFDLSVVNGKNAGLHFVPGLKVTNKSLQ